MVARCFLRRKELHGEDIESKTDSGKKSLLWRKTFSASIFHSDVGRARQKLRHSILI